jgi:hypothetical protein
MNQDSLVDIATGLGLDGQGSIPDRGKILSSPQHSDRLSTISNGYWGHLPRVLKRPRREADHSPSSGAVVRNSEAILPVPHMPS